MKNIKNVEVAINDFAMHLIIFIFRNALEYKNADRKKKTMRQRGQTKRRSCQRKCFHLFNYLIDNASIRFFSYVNSLHCLV